MKYAYWKGAERICTISEPFLTPVVQHVLGALGGNGVPDYPDEMREVLKQILDDFSKTAIPVAAAALSGAQQPPVATA